MNDNPEFNSNTTSDSKDFKSESDNKQLVDAKIASFLKSADEAFKKVKMISRLVHSTSHDTKDSDLTIKSKPTSDVAHNLKSEPCSADTSASQDIEECEDDGDTAEYII